MIDRAERSESRGVELFLVRATATGMNNYLLNSIHEHFSNRSDGIANGTGEQQSGVQRCATRVDE